MEQTLVRISRLLLLWCVWLATACNADDGGRNEQMVDLQHVKDNPKAQLATLNKAIALAGRDGSLYARRAMVLLQEGEPERALQDADQAVLLAHGNPLSLFVKAQVLRALNRPAEALPLALQAERNSYQSASLYVLLGELYLQRHDYVQALTYIKKAQELSPTSAYAFYYKGRVLAEQGDSAKAVQQYLLALQEAPNLVEPRRELAAVLVAQNRYDEAAPIVDAVAKQAPQDGQVLFLKGMLYRARQEQDSAQVFFNRALAVNDTLQSARFYLGLQLYSQGYNNEALSNLLKAQRKYKNNQKYLMALAGSYERMAQPQNALATYERLLKVAPANSYAPQAIARLRYRLQKATQPDSLAVRLERERRLNAKISIHD